MKLPRSFRLCVSFALALAVLPGTAASQGPVVKAYVAPEDGGFGASYWFKTERGSVLIDAPYLLDHAKLLKAELERDGVTELGAVILTSGRPEHVWGLVAVRSPATRVWTSRANALRIEKEFAARRVSALRAGLAISRLAPAPPAVTNSFSGSLNLGFEGFTLRLMEMPEATPLVPLVAFIPETGELFAGDLVPVRVHPPLDEIELPGLRRALLKLKTLRARRVYPGHGAASGPEAIDALLGYLSVVEESVRPLARRAKRLSARELAVLKKSLVRRFPDWALAGQLDRSLAAELERQRLLEEGP